MAPPRSKLSKPSKFERWSWTVPEASRGMRLDHFIFEHLGRDRKEPLSKARVRAILVAGGVYLNRKRARIASKNLLPGATVEVVIDASRLEGHPSQRPAHVQELTATDILYEDEHLILISKPAGIPTQATLDNARDHAFAMLKRYLEKREGIHDIYLGLHHRLDRDTSGVLLFTKTKVANRPMGDLFQGRAIEKTYVAIVGLDPARKEPVPDTFEVKNFLKKEGSKRSARMVSTRSGGDPAETSFRILKRSSKALLVEAQPKTGRMHQIRVHCSELGLPILGDSQYGDRRAAELGAPRSMLHALRLRFSHPLKSGQTVDVEAPLPHDFRLCLERALGS